MYFSTERNRRMAQRLFALIRDETTDRCDDSFEYDLSMYTSAEAAAAEREKIFGRMPVMAAHSSQLPEINSFITLQMNQSNVLLTRRKDGSVAAFLNICRHRGAALVDAPSGKRPLFTCRYHGWTYANGGELKAVTFPESFGELPCGRRDLVSLPVEERHGFIWVLENPQGHIDVRAHLGDEMDQALADYAFDKWFFYKDEVFDFPQNWKIMMDGLFDGYHVQFLHGKTINPYFYPNTMGIEILGPHAISATPRRAIEAILDEEPGQSALDPYIVVGNMLSPNSGLILHPHHIEYWTIYQNVDDVNRCRAHLRYLAPQQNPNDDERKILEKNWGIAARAILNEDVPVGNSIQASARAPQAGRVILGRNEMLNQLFHRSYREYMR